MMPDWLRPLGHKGQVIYREVIEKARKAKPRNFHAYVRSTLRKRLLEEGYDVAALQQGKRNKPRRETKSRDVLDEAIALAGRGQAAKALDLLILGLDP